MNLKEETELNLTLENSGRYIFEQEKEINRLRKEILNAHKKELTLLQIVQNRDMEIVELRGVSGALDETQNQLSYKEIKAKYQALHGSKLGQLQLAYWKLLAKLRKNK